MMKKKWALLLVLLMTALTFFACGGEKERTAALFDGETEKEGYYIEFETGVSGQAMYLKMHVKGSRLYVEADTGGYVSELIKNEDGFFVLSPEYRIGYKVNEEMFDDSLDVNLLTSMSSSLEGKEFTTGKANVDGEAYEFEEFKEDGVVTKFMYDEEDQLKYIIVESEDGGMDPQKMKVIRFKKGADESKFKIPGSYTIEDWHEIDDWYDDGDDWYDDYDNI